MNFRAPLTSDKHFNKSYSRNVTQTGEPHATIPKLPYLSPSLYIIYVYPRHSRLTFPISNRLFRSFPLFLRNKKWNISTSTSSSIWISHVTIANRDN